MRSARLLIPVAALAAVLAAPAPAQTLIFQNDVGVDYSEIRVSGTNLLRVRPDGTTVGRPVPASSVVRVEWPQPQELIDAEALIIQGRHDQALPLAEKVQKTHELWKDKPGSWYADASLLVAQIRLLRKEFDVATRLISQIRALPLTPAQQTQVAILEPLEQYLKGMTGPALAKAQAQAKTAEDPAALTRLHLLIGDIQLKRESFQEALDAYLHIPVFFGAQAAYLPAADLGVARSLLRLRRTADAASAFNRIVRRYPGTPEAEAARKELASLESAGSAAAD